MSPTTTTALVIPELNGRFALREISLDKLQDDEALVEIEAFGVCHTDISCSTGRLACEPGAVLGHEGGGTVLEVGSKVSTVAKGDKVLLSFSYCGNCRWCKAGKPAYCYDFMPRNFGGKRPDGTAALLSRPTDAETPKPLFSSFFGQSSFAHHTIVNVSTLVKVTPETPLALFAPLGCGIQTGFGSVVNTLNVQPGSSIAIFGVGSVGMAALMAAKYRQAAVIIAVDLQPSRLELAKELGATHVVIGSEDVVARIREICPPVGVDYAVECTGYVPVIENMISALGTKGRAATVGAAGANLKVSLDVMLHLGHGREYVGCAEGDSNPPEFIPHLMDLHAQGHLPLEKIITQYKVSDHEQAIADMHSGKIIKPVLVWD